MTWKRISDRTEELRGTAIDGTGAKPQQQYGQGRKCAEPGCSTVLSVYNSNDKCYAHTEVVPEGLDDREIRRTRNQ